MEGAGRWAQDGVSGQVGSPAYGFAFRNGSTNKAGGGVASGGGVRGPARARVEVGAGAMLVEGRLTDVPFRAPPVIHVP